VLRLSNILRRFSALFAAILLLAGIAIPLATPSPADAVALLTARSLTLSSSAVGTVSTGNPGEGNNGAKTKHTVGFTLATGGNVGSILIQYCTSPVIGVTCTTPTGFDANNLPNASSTLATTGFNAGAFSVDKATSNPSGCNGGTSTTRDNCVLIKRSSAVSESATAKTVAYGGSSSDYIKNPTTANYSFYARIFTYSDTGYATLVDNGGVAASTTQGITITAKVAEKLDFSVGTTVTHPTDPQTCTPFNDAGTLTLGDVNGVLATNQAYDAHSYFRVNSNSVGGTVIYYSGDTLKNGANSITSAGLSTNGVSSTPGFKQFGLALDQNDTNPNSNTGAGYSFTDLNPNNHTNIGAHPYDYSAGGGSITSGGTAKFQFDTASLTSPDPVAYSTGGIQCDTGSIRYVANVSNSTPAGIYTTTITYIATGTY
jgi:hypothetical protein